jgi:hypothetical protein
VLYPGGASKSKALAEMAAFGLTPDDYSPEERQKLLADDTVGVWPDNWLSVCVFDAMGTQWNVGMGGPIGLRYESLREVRLRYAIPASEWRHVFDDLQLMEAHALEQMHRKSKES